jgi:hypothetical protein
MTAHARRIPLALETLEARLAPAASVVSSPDTSFHRHLMGDFDGDGRADTAGFADNGVWSVLRSTGDRFDDPVEWADWAGRSVWVRLFAGDFSGDGKDDVAGLHYPGQWFVGVSNGSSFDSSFWGDVPNPVARSLVTGDFNGDGKADLAALTPVGDLNVSLSDGDSFQTTTWATGLTGKWHRLLVGDFNGDGNDDLAGLQQGTWRVGISSGTSFTFSQWGSWTDTIAAARILVGDFNGDSSDDVAGITRRNELIFAASTETAFDTQNLGAIWPRASAFLAGNFDADGSDEIAARRGADVRIVHFDDSGILDEQQIGWGTNSAWPYGWAADFDGDGTDDIAVRTGMGAWFITPMGQGGVPVAHVWFYPYAGEIPPYADGAPWNPSFARKFVQVTPLWLHRHMNFNDRTAFNDFVYTYFGVLKGWQSEAVVLGLDPIAFRAFLGNKLNEKFEQVRPQLEAQYSGLTDNQYRLLMSMNLAHALYRYGKGSKSGSLLELLGLPGGNCAHYARAIQEMALIQGMQPTHFALFEKYTTPFGPFSSGHNFVICEGLFLDGETNLAFNFGSLEQLFSVAPPARLPWLAESGRIYGFYNWLNSPPIRSEQLARGQDGGAIAYFYWFYLWGLDQGSTKLLKVAPLSQ